MKVYFIILVLALYTNPCIAQWNLSGNPIIGDNSDAIGYSMSINGAGDRVVFVKDGPSGGNYYDFTFVLELQDYRWVQLGTEVQAANMDTSSFVAMNALGNRIVIGENRFNDENIVRVFEFQLNGWVQLGSTIISESDNDYFGTSLAINAEGDTIICGAPGTGYSKVYQLINNEWEQKGETLNDGYGNFGESVSINAKGNIIAVSTPNDDENGVDSGKVNIYRYQNSDWIDFGQPIYGTQTGDLLGIGNKPGTNGIDLNGMGNVIVIGCWGHRIFPDDQAGQVNVYEFLNNAWSQKGETIEGTYENHYFGGSVSINNTGDIIVAGDFSAFGFGEVKVFKYEFDSWEQYGNTLSGEENGLESFFGFSVGINNEGNVIGIGSPHDSGWEPSQVRVFEYNGVLDAQELMRENVPKLYPNPNFGRFFISIPDVMKAPLIRIADSMGKIIYSKSHSVSKLIEIDQNLSSGIYFVNILTLNSSSILRLIVE